jgi:(2Fe-2S) ferredoxin
VRRSCLGTCTGEPLAHVEPDDVRYSASSGEDLLRICERHALEGEPSPSRLATNRAELSTTAVPAPR